MSYILEALADSEQARLQIAAAPRYSLLPAVGEEIPRARVWPYALAGALLVNAVVLQLWLRPAAPGSVATIQAPSASPAAETAVAAAEPRILPSGGNEKPAADLAEIAPRETSLPPAKPASAYELRAAAVPAAASPGTRSANVASASTHAPGSAAKVTVKRKAEPAVAKGAAATGVAKVAAASAAAVVATAPVAAKAATPTAGIAAVAAPALAATAPAAGSDLPPALQQELPVLAVAGFIRDDGSSGMVIVNDSLAREGDEVAPGVKLERIVGDSLVFNYKGYRFKR